MYLVLIGFASQSTLFTFDIVRFCKIYTTRDPGHSKTAAGKMFDISVALKKKINLLKLKHIISQNI